MFHNPALHVGFQSTNIDTIASGDTAYTGGLCVIEGALDLLFGIVYRLADDVGVTFTWGVEWSLDGATWFATTPATSIITTLVPANSGTPVIGHIKDVSKNCPGRFARIIGVGANFTNDTVLISSWMAPGYHDKIMDRLPLSAFVVSRA